MESRIEELEVAVRIAEAKADVAISLVRLLITELGRSEVVSWSDGDLVRELINGFQEDDPARDHALLDILPADEPSETPDNAYNRDLRSRRVLRAKVLDQIRHERNPS